MKVKSLSRVRLLATSWTAAYQAPPSMGFSRQECWSGVPLPSPTMEYYSAIKKNTFESILIKWTNLEPIIHSEVSWKEKDKYCNSSVQSLSRPRLLATPWTAAYQAPPSMGFSRQEYWSGVPLPSPKKCTNFIILHIAV